LLATIDEGGRVSETESWPRPVGGHVALDFVNTDVISQHDRSVDILRSMGELLAWCEYIGLPVQASAALDLAPAQQGVLTAKAGLLRTAVRTIVEAMAGQRPPDDQALTDLRSAYADAVGRAVPTMDGGRLVWRWDPVEPEAALDHLSSAAVELLHGGRTDRIKVCPSCGFVFLDATKNGSRRWCSMDDCGKQEKIRRFVVKRAEKGKAER
jgi:predicted RNA-binding Zn ribbon-like protein